MWIINGDFGGFVAGRGDDAKGAIAASHQAPINAPKGNDCSN